MRFFASALVAGCLCASVLAQDATSDQTVLEHGDGIEELDYQSDAARLLKVKTDVLK